MIFLNFPSHKLAGELGFEPRRNDPESIFPSRTPFVFACLLRLQVTYVVSCPGHYCLHAIRRDLGIDGGRVDVFVP